MKKLFRFKKGGVAIALLLIVSTIPLIIGSYTSFSLNNQRTTQRSIQYMKERVVAENVISSGVAAFYRLLKQDPTASPNELKKNLNKSRYLNTLKSLPLDGEDEDNGFRVAVVHFENQRMGRTNLVSIVAGVNNVITGVKVATRATYVVVEQPFLDYAIFTEGIFELSPWPSMDVNGDVRSNDKIRIGGGASSSGKLSFFGQLWSANDIDIFKGWSGSEINSSQRMRVKASDGLWKNFYSTYNGTPIPLDSAHPNWNVESVSRWGDDTVRAGVPSLQVPVDSSDTHKLIEPRDTSNDDPTLKREKLAWKADKPGGLIITVKANGSISYKKDGGSEKSIKGGDIASLTGLKDPSTGEYQVANNGWIKLTPSSYIDRREKKYSKSPGVRLVDLYMDKLINKFPNTKIVYVKMEDENGDTKPYLEALKDDSSLRLPAVRIRNGNDLSAAANGMTVATHRFAYVEGNFNAEAGKKVSALVAADNLTVLSNAWNDNTSWATKTDASETYLNTVLLVGGYTYKEDKPSSSIDGLHNLVRYLENWHDAVGYHFSGSYVKLFNAEESFCNSNSYFFNAPRRYVTYDPTLVGTPPPGMPTGLNSPEVVRWEEIPWSEAVSSSK